MVTRKLMRTLASTAWGPLDHSRLVDPTEREIEVLTEVGRGASNDEVAATLYDSPARARTYVSRLLTKLHARDRSQLVVLAYQTGLVTPETDRSRLRLDPVTPHGSGLHSAPMTPNPYYGHLRQK